VDTKRSERVADRPGTENGRRSADEQWQQGAPETRSTTPWGFLLVLASIVVIAVVYSVTMWAIGDRIRTPATAIAAMTAVFPVISALVGAYFGVKAGLDGQEKAKEIMDRALREERPRNRRDDR
jgi:protein-S-isoprenylcysteine O-methyltransferase Ste14